MKKKTIIYIVVIAAIAGAAYYGYTELKKRNLTWLI